MREFIKGVFILGLLVSGAYAAFAWFDHPLWNRRKSLVTMGQSGVCLRRTAYELR